jgi:hypothetical protein
VSHTNCARCFGTGFLSVSTGRIPCDGLRTAEAPFAVGDTVSVVVGEHTVYAVREDGWLRLTHEDSLTTRWQNPRICRLERRRERGPSCRSEASTSTSAADAASKADAPKSAPTTSTTETSVSPSTVSRSGSASPSTGAASAPPSAAPNASLACPENGGGPHVPDDEKEAHCNGCGAWLGNGVRALCIKAPPGWSCSRDENHDGPCAARLKAADTPCKPSVLWTGTCERGTFTCAVDHKAGPSLSPTGAMHQAIRDAREHARREAIEGCADICDAEALDWRGSSEYGQKGARDCAARIRLLLSDTPFTRAAQGDAPKGGT